MLCVTAFHPKDAAQSLRQAEWLRELGGCAGHSLILVADTACPVDTTETLRSAFAQSFDNVALMPFVDHYHTWPEAPNAIFAMVARHIESNRPQPWFFFEPDVIFLKPQAIDLFAAEYQSARKPFSGDFVSVHTPELDVIDHCSGNAIYPGEMTRYAGRALIAHEIAWDCEAADQIVPQMHRSRLLHHSWKDKGFKTWAEFETRVLAFKSDCAIFHADKSQSLYPLLRERLSGHLTAVQPLAVQARPIAGAAQLFEFREGKLSQVCQN